MQAMRGGFFLLLAAALAAHAEDVVKPVLPADPTVARILASLGDNGSALLPEGKVVGEFNELAKRFNLDTRGPTSRDFTVKMA